MKRNYIFLSVTIIATMIFTACNGSESGSTKDPVLTSETDSLNYTYGIALGNDLMVNLLNKDSVKQKTKLFMDGLAVGAEGEADEKPGISATAVQLGGWLKQQKTNGLLNDSTLKFNYKLVKKGLINGLNKLENEMTPQQANEYINKVMTERQQQKMEN